MFPGRPATGRVGHLHPALLYLYNIRVGHQDPLRLYLYNKGWSSVDLDPLRLYPYLYLCVWCHLFGRDLDMQVG